ncbi:MAG: 4-(cytidine 5'-diphospho)-2-C-methyl-D-erythritol kinase [bacterium]|nr:4-(cytidine 5'-diphospho)-2-C-methyl-D-erythritol kinase [bacterium]
MIIRTPAKVNLFLDVIERQSSGFHTLQTILQAVSLFDEITIRKSANTRVLTSHKGLKGTHNIVEDAVHALKQRYAGVGNFRFDIKKRIPLGAGMAGGSSDAAAALCGINILSGLGLNHQELAGIGKDIGKDIPFFLKGGLQIGRHYGEELEWIKSRPVYYFLIIYPGFGISTKESYQDLNPDTFNQGAVRFKKLVRALKTGDYGSIKANLYNIFEANAFKKKPLLRQIKADLMEAGADNSLMSGTGSAVFGLFRTRIQAEKTKKKLKKNYKNIILSSGFYRELFTD